VKLERQIRESRLLDKRRDRRQLGDAAREDGVAHRPGQLKRIDGAMNSIRVQQASQAGDSACRHHDLPPAPALRGKRAPAQGRVDQAKAEQNRSKHEQALRIDPGRLHKRQQPSQQREPVPATEDGQVDSEVEQAERLGPDVHPT
jgi:hypothetical protein